MNIYRTLDIGIKCFLISTLVLSQSVHAEIKLADKPLFTSYTVPGNLALALSVEYPTALSPSYRDSYSTSNEYLGYFDPNKCYYYNNTNSDARYRYFEPMAAGSGHVCNASPASRHWSGNFLNWATSQTIDPFRQVLTGGYRHIDDVNLTVLEKAWNSGQSGSVFTKILPANFVKGATPFKFNGQLITEVDGWGNQIAFAASGFANPSVSASFPSASNLSTVPSGGVKVSEDKLYYFLDDSITNTAQKNLFTVFARVQVCKGSDLNEKNCVAYGGNYKPEGLIQKNALKMNFAAFGYLNQDDSYQSGGVLRARMSALGPMMPDPGKQDKINPNPEWNATTGQFLSHPRPIDEAESGGSGSGIVRSGVINYLNNFGQYSPNRTFAYMHFDEASELYYAISRYYRNKGNYTPFTKKSNGQALSSSQLDGFPAITTWDDPIKYACQQNFVIGLGDTHNSYDARLPGSTLAANESPQRDSPLPTDDPSIDVTKSTNYIGLAQGYITYKALGEKPTPWCCPGATFYIAGLAYDLHVSDMRPEIGSNGNEVFPGKQTAKTYWLDVLEADTPIDHKDVGEKGMRNQYWLAAKYGGFDVPAGNFNPYDTTNPLTLKSSQWDTNGDDDPDTYFRANNPKIMQENLSKAFDDILRNLTKPSSALAVTNQNITDGDYAYTSSYAVDGWSGDITAKRTSVDNSTGLVSTSTAIWSAADNLEARDLINKPRTIATAKCTIAGNIQKCSGIPFQLSSLDSIDTSYLAGLTDANGAAINASDVLNYLRGDRTIIANNRKKRLGDITAPQPIVVSSPNAGYSDATNPGYADFKNNKKLRPTVIYSGANDGMLHAFAGGASGGNELFAYVPQALFKGPSDPPTPNDDGLASLAKPSYSHHAYVDKTPVVQDVNFGSNTAPDWHSILVGGLGKGGKAYYALDVTDPASMTNESQLAPKVLWEFKHPNLGFSYGKPLIVKTKQYGWVVMLASGYNNADGKGHIFILNPKDGSLIQELATSGNTNSDGLAHLSAFINSFSDNTADAAYAGDLQGNLWRLDLTKTTAENYYEPPSLIAQLTSESGMAQPITTPPALALDSYTGKRYVFVGTGRLLDDSDITSTQEHSFYAILDGTRTKFLEAPANPLTRKDFANNTDVTGVTLTSNQSGWFINLGTGANGNAYRINTPITVSASVVAFAKNLPDNSDVCNPSGSAEGFGINYSTGKTLLPGTLANVHIDGLVSLINFYNTAPFDKGVVISFNADGTTTGSTTDPCPNNQCRTVSIANAFRVLNWREVPNTD